jgi:predicted MFS family arabinose efflux permease
VLFSVAWNPMFTDVVAARSRAAVMSTRSILSAAIVAPLIFLAGRWLDSQQGTFPRNYQWLFLVGFVGGAISVYLVARIRAPQKALPAKSESRKSNWRDMLGFSILRENPQFRRLMVNSFLISLGSWFVGPLYIIFYVRQLGASDSWIGATATLSNLGVIVGYWLGRKLVKKLGENKGLLVTLPTTVTWPFLVALVPNLTVILIGGFIQNVITPGWSLSHTMIWMSRLPDKNKMTATAVYNTAMNVGAFVMPMLGVALSEAIGIRNTLLIGGALNILGGLMFYIRPVTSRQEEPEAAPQGA